MFKFSGTEKGMLALTGAFLLLTVGYFLLQENTGDEYSVQKQTFRISEVGAAVQAVRPEGEQCVNINTAGMDELQTLPGIGPVLAQRIVESREQQGEFRIPEDILRVSGIGQSTLSKILDYITVE